MFTITFAVGPFVAMRIHLVIALANNVGNSSVVRGLPRPLLLLLLLGRQRWLRYVRIAGTSIKGILISMRRGVVIALGIRCIWVTGTTLVGRWGWVGVASWWRWRTVLLLMSLPVGFVVASGPFRVGAGERIASRAANTGIAKWISGQAVITRYSRVLRWWWKRSTRWVRIGTGWWRPGKGRGGHHPNITAWERSWGRIVGARPFPRRWRISLLWRMRRRLDESKLARPPPRPTAGGTTMTGRYCRRRSVRILGRQLPHRFFPIETTDLYRLSRLKVVPAQGVIPGEHEVIEIVTALGNTSALGDVEGCLLASLVSILYYRRMRYKLKSTM